MSTFQCLSFQLFLCEGASAYIALSLSFPYRDRKTRVFAARAGSCLLVAGPCPVPCRMFGRVPGVHAPNARVTSLPPALTTKNVPRPGGGGHTTAPRCEPLKSADPCPHCSVNTRVCRERRTRVSDAGVLPFKCQAWTCKPSSGIYEESPLGS